MYTLAYMYTYDYLANSLVAVVVVVVVVVAAAAAAAAAMDRFQVFAASSPMIRTR